MSNKPRALLLTLFAMACVPVGLAAFIILASLPGYWGIFLFLAAGACGIYRCALDGLNSRNRPRCPHCDQQRRKGGDPA